MHRKRMENEAEGRGTVGALERFLEQAVDEMIVAGTGDARAEKFREDTRKSVLEGSYYRRVFRGDEVLERPVLKPLKPTAAKMLRQKAVKDRVTRFDAERQAVIARLKRKVKHYEGKGNRGDKKIERLAVAVVGEGRFFEGRKRNVTDRSRECGFSLAQYMRRSFEL